MSDDRLKNRAGGQHPSIWDLLDAMFSEHPAGHQEPPTPKPKPTDPPNIRVDGIVYQCCIVKAEGAIRWGHLAELATQGLLVQVVSKPGEALKVRRVSADRFRGWTTRYVGMKVRTFYEPIPR